MMFYAIFFTTVLWYKPTWISVINWKIFCCFWGNGDFLEPPQKIQHNTTDMLVTTIDRIFYKSSHCCSARMKDFCQWRFHAQWRLFDFFSLLAAAAACLYVCLPLRSYVFSVDVNVWVCAFVCARMFWSNSTIFCWVYVRHVRFRFCLITIGFY